MGNAFAQLPDVWLPQVFIQFGLSKQHDLQQFMLLSFKIGEQADFLQRGNRHALGFLHKHDDLALLAMALDQIVV